MLFKVSAVFLVCVCVRISDANNDDGLVVELVKPNGKIRGHVLRSAKAKKYYAFQEIPYGNPPIGKKRFKPPEDHGDWDGILDCTRNTKSCYQFMWRTNNNYSLLSDRNRAEMKQSEDCLYLNVYTPVKPGSNKSLSVYFYIHGGAFSLGDGTFSNYGPKYLIDGNIVIVTMNYRLGPFGFLSTGDSEISGNMGLKDQHLALKWTHKNIHLFGGNPEDIVLGGESTGSFSVGYHLLSPRTKGLVSGYILQSGSHMGVSAFTLNPRKYAFELGRALTPTASRNTKNLLHNLREFTAEEIVNGSASVSYPPYIGFIPSIIWTPVVENKNNHEAFITSPMYDDIMKGHFNRSPCLMGFTSEESLYFLPDDENLQKIAALYDAHPSLLINSALNVKNMTRVGEKLKEFYTSTSFQEDPQALIRFSSDAFFTRAIFRQAELTSKHVPVYLYKLSAFKNINDEYPGDAHTLEVRYLWDFPARMIDTSPVDEELRQILLKLWWNFIKYKNPTPEKDSMLQDIIWPTVGQEKTIYLNLNKSFSIESNPRNYRNLRSLLIKYMKPPYYVF